MTPNWIAYAIAGVVTVGLLQLWEGKGVFLGVAAVAVYEIWHRWKYGESGL